MNCDFRIPFSSENFCTPPIFVSYIFAALIFLHPSKEPISFNTEFELNFTLL